MSASAARIREDFDRIARLTADETNRLSPYDGFLLRQIPIGLHRVLEIGCGTGGFSRALAARGHDVTGIDLSPEMIRRARERVMPEAPARFLCCDFMTEATAGGPYDCVVSIATLHHLDLDGAVRRMAALVRPRGLLLIHDLRSDRGVAEWIRLVPAMLARGWTRVRARRLWDRAEVRAAWAEHGREERYPSMAEVEAWAAALLPGARTTRHLQWRYTVAWWRRDRASR